MTDATRYLTVEDVVQLTGWTRAYVLKRASLDKWGRLGSKPQKYRMADVLASSRSTPDTRIRTHLLARHG